MSEFRSYVSRNISSAGTHVVGDWTLKLYCITANPNFALTEALFSAIEKSEAWLKEFSDASLPTHRNAFLVLHEATDGVWLLLNWWTGKEMLRTATFYASAEEPVAFKLQDRVGSMACVWEMEVIDHERRAWIEHILKRPENPDFDAYLADQLNTSF